MVKVLFVMLMPIVALLWYSGVLNNIFSDYQRKVNHYAMVIRTEQDYTNFSGNVTKIMDNGSARFVGGFIGCGYAEVSYQKRKTNQLYFWE